MFVEMIGKTGESSVGTTQKYAVPTELSRIYEKSSYKYVVPSGTKSLQIAS